MRAIKNVNLDVLNDCTNTDEMVRVPLHSHFLPIRQTVMLEDLRVLHPLKMSISFSVSFFSRFLVN